jgi:N-acetylglucosaminyl-diphospho-decaprenol L-rhamnosyltransferase
MLSQRSLYVIINCQLSIVHSPLVSAVILNFRSHKATVHCVGQLLQQSIADQMEIIVIDNHSDSESIGYLRANLRHLPVRIVETKANLGFGTGYDEGIKHARGSFILINNPVKILEKTGVEKMLQKMQRDPSIGIIAPKLVHPDGSLRESSRAFPRPLDVISKRTFLKRWFPGSMRRYLDQDRDPETERDTDWIAGGCLMIRKDLFQSIGGFDHRFFLFFEDIDLCRRVWQAGKRVVYAPSIVGSDRKSRLSEGGPWSLMTSPVGRTHIASALKYFWKWGLMTGRPTIVASR